jgi:pimeloyl-ACP methyl ester carboxylesterase
VTLIGGCRELAAVEQLPGRAAARIGGHLIVSGPPGAGKTALTTAADLARARRLPVPPAAGRAWTPVRPPGTSSWATSTPAQDLAERRARDQERHPLPRHRIPPRDRRWLESTLPGVTITVLPGSGHFPHPAHPAELAEILTGREERRAAVGGLLA